MINAWKICHKFLEFIGFMVFKTTDLTKNFAEKFVKTMHFSQRYLSNKRRKIIKVEQITQAT